MTDKDSNNELVEPNPEKKNKMETAFLQVPVEIKEQVVTYIDDLMKDTGKDIQADKSPMTDLPSHGCFLVISLEKIEDIKVGLENCLSMKADKGAENIKSKIRNVLKLIN